MDHLGHDGGNLGLHPEVHQDPLVLAPLLGAPRAPALRVQPRVLDRALGVLGARDDAAGGLALQDPQRAHRRQVQPRKPLLRQTSSGELRS